MPKRNVGAAEPTADTNEQDAAIILSVPPKPEESKKPKPIRATIVAEHRLTDEEIVVISAELAEAHEEIDQLEEQRKNLNDQKKNEIASVEARMNEAVRKIRSRSETREYFCEAELDFDLKIKRWRDVKTGIVVKSEELSARDYQQQLRFETGVSDGTQTSTGGEGNGHDVDAAAGVTLDGADEQHAQEAVN
jgi:inorganic pyrophosphatase